MGENTGFVKGDAEDIIKRFSMVHTLNMRCPLNDEGVGCLYVMLETSLKSYFQGNGMFVNIPIIDLYNAFIRTLGFCKEKGINTDKLYIMWGCIQSFVTLKYISLDFCDNKDVVEAYENINEKSATDDEKLKMLGTIYDIIMLEFNLSNMFSQDVIDIFNKCMILNGLLSNSYLKREFFVTFDYDGYIAFMEMFLTNNKDRFDDMDKSIIEYFRMFPVFVANQKPMIKIVTNYREI